VGADSQATPAPDLTQQFDEGGYPLRLSYNYLSGLDEDGLDALSAHILSRMDDNNELEGERWQDFDLFTTVQQGQDEIVDDLGSGGASDEEITAAVARFVEANGRPGLTHPDVGGRGAAPTRVGPSRAEVQAEYATFVELQYLAASEATKGYMVNARGQALGITDRALFSGDIRAVYRYATPELLEFWEGTRRVGWSEYYYERTQAPGSAAAAARQRAENAQINRDRTNRPVSSTRRRSR